MPLRKKSDLSASSRCARKMKKSRSRMSDENRKAKLAAARERQARLRASESSIEREIRLTKKRASGAAVRRMESEKKRKAYLAADRLRNALSRHERESRLSSRRARKTADRMLKRIEKAQSQASQINFNQEDYKEPFTSQCYMPQDSTHFDTSETTQEFNDGSANDSIRDASIDYNFSPDQYSVYGENIAHRLRNCQRNNYEIFIAQHYIDEIIFKLSMGCYSPMNEQINRPVPSSTSATSSESISIPSTSMPTTSAPDTSTSKIPIPNASTVIPTTTTIIEPNTLESENPQRIILKEELDL